MNGLRNLAFDAIERQHGVFHLAFLEVDARQPIGGVVANLFVDGTLEDRLDRTARAVVHAVAQLEVTERELRIVEVGVERVEIRLVDGDMLSNLGVEAIKRFEIPPLVGVIQRFAEPGVLDAIGPSRTSGQDRQDG